MTKVEKEEFEFGAREKLKEVAIRLFAQRGLEGVSVRDLAKEAGVNVSLISYHFGGKEGLYKKTIEEYAASAAQEMTQFVANEKSRKMDHQSFRALMRSILGRILAFKMKSPEINELMMRELISGLPLLREVYESLLNPVALEIVNVFDEAKKQKIMKQNVHSATLFLSMIHAIDAQFLARKCRTELSKKSFCLPEQTDLFLEQILIIFIDGALTHEK